MEKCNFLNFIFYYEIIIHIHTNKSFLLLFCQKVCKMGGRKFGFQNLGPIGCMPATKASLGITSDCAHEPSVIAKNLQYSPTQTHQEDTKTATRIQICTI